MTNQNPKFEDCYLEGVGNIKDFENLSIEEMRAQISDERYGLFMATKPIPEGWPQEIMRNRMAELIKDEEKIKIEENEWYVNFEGKKWSRFYGFGLKVYLEELKLIPAFIYERKTGGVYLPVVSMLIDFDNLVIKQASKSWCDDVISRIKDRLKTEK